MLCPEIPVQHKKLVPDPALIAEQYAKLSLIVGLRFHGHVLAAMQSVPFVGVSDDGKVADLCAAFNMPHFRIGGVTSEVLINAIVQTQAARPDVCVLDELASQASSNYAGLRRVFL